MSFLEEIKKEENKRTNNEELVINEIVEYFKNKLNSEKFEEKLKNRIVDKINRGEKQLRTRIEFWEYCSGCSPTNFSCGFYEFTLDYGEYDYKGIRLYEIQEKIGEKLTELYKNKLKNLGLKIVEEKRLDNTCRFGYYRNELTIVW